MFRLAPRPLAEGKIKVDKKSLVGLPIPVAGGLIAAIIHSARCLDICGPKGPKNLFSPFTDPGGRAQLANGQHASFSSFKTVGPQAQHANHNLGVAVGC